MSNLFTDEIEQEELYKEVEANYYAMKNNVRNKH